ncbi:MAG: DUF4230 domain-containing protein [Erysipelotrichaceae bacterium]|nr:DUF4230 domain-containing protein [Erysipelotrichaceae bacterium]MBQ1512515.1 DUF4230 domain-containing protein [Erysipelotrichaceae bacterium]
MKRTHSFLKGVILGILVGFILTVGISYHFRKPLLQKIEHLKETTDLFLDNTFLGYTAADFEEGVIGAATEHKELIVMEQEISVTTTITKAGLANLEIFSKSKDITMVGAGVYTVDLSGIRLSNIEVDNEEKVVRIHIPHAKLQYVNIDFSRTQFSDTEKGLLAFGDISLTTEQQNELQVSVEQAMRQELETNENVLKNADEMAVMKTWEIFQPLITSVAVDYRVEMVFD